MKRSFVLGFIAGMLFMLLVGGAIGGWFSYQKYQETLQQRDAEVRRAEELAQKLQDAQDQAEEARREADLARMNAEYLANQLRIKR